MRPTCARPNDPLHLAKHFRDDLAVFDDDLAVYIKITVRATDVNMGPAVILALKSVAHVASKRNSNIAPLEFGVYQASRLNPFQLHPVPERASERAPSNM